jgi:6-methylsalicylate decarboxylase
VVDYTAQMQAAYVAWLAEGASVHPKLPVVFAILAGGGPVQVERLRVRGGLLGALPASMYLETSSFGRKALELCLATHGRAQVLYGSDSPLVDPQATLRALAELGDAVADAVRVENPTRLFG